MKGKRCGICDALGCEEDCEKFANLSNSAEVPSYTLKREYGKTPNGNDLNGRWVLRNQHGVFVDFDQYRNDLIERHKLTIIEGVGDAMRGLKNLSRFGLEWEWMSEGKDGEYVRYEDVEKMLQTVFK